MKNITLAFLLTTTFLAHTPVFASASIDGEDDSNRPSRKRPAEEPVYDGRYDKSARISPRHEHPSSRTLEVLRASIPVAISIGNYKGAAQSAVLILAHDNLHITEVAELGSLFILAQQWDHALTASQRILALQNVEEYYWDLANTHAAKAYAGKGEWGKALEIFEKYARDTAPEAYRFMALQGAIKALSKVTTHTDNVDKAQNYLLSFCKSQDLTPQNKIDAYFDFLETIMNSKQWSKAQDHLNDFLSLRDLSAADQYHIQFSYGLCHFHSEKWDQALQHFNTALRMPNLTNQEKYTTLRNIAKCHQESGDIEKALQCQTETLSLKGLLPKQKYACHLTIAAHYFNNENWGKSSEHLQHALKSGGLTESQRGVANYHLGTSHFRAKQWNMAIARLILCKQLPGLSDDKIAKIDEMMRAALSELPKRPITNKTAAKTKG